MNIARKNYGFTLIELLVVIAIISLLSSVVLASISSARVKARDSRRSSDIKSIHTALQLYQDKYGCIPTTIGPTTCGNASGINFADWGGWDYSAAPTSFLFFLATGTEPIMRKVPLDPLNNMTGDDSPSNSYSYRYYCYSDGLVLGYWTENPSRTYKTSSVLVGLHDSDFICK